LIEELGEIEANHRYEMSIGKGTYIDCFKGTIGTTPFHCQRHLLTLLLFCLQASVSVQVAVSKLSSSSRVSISSSITARHTLSGLVLRIRSSSLSSPSEVFSVLLFGYRLTFV
jgi:hypothetical protein